MLKIAIVQQRPAYNQLNESIEKAKVAVKEAARKGAQLIKKDVFSFQVNRERK